MRSFSLSLIPLFLLAACNESEDVGQGEAAVTALPVVHTESGDVQASKIIDSIAAYRDVPYAAPPVNGLRWKPPQPHVAWTGTFHAPQYEGGIACISNNPAGTDAAPSPGESEDCLYLDVYTPASASGAPRPVLFFLHGGFGQIGKKGNVDGAALAKASNMVVVSANYRLGALGYLTHPELAREQGTAGNYAHLDQIAALKWVKNNIGAFGGDPNEVTLSGQSWGAHSTCTLVASPLAHGLFQGAVMMSAPDCRTADKETAFEAGKAYADKLNCSGANLLECLRRKPAKDAAHAIPADFWSRNYRWYSVVDGNVLPEKSEKLIAAGRQNAVPMMIGTTTEESSTIEQFIVPSVGDHAHDAWSRDDYAAGLEALYPSSGAKVLAQYPPRGNVRAQVQQILTDQRFVCPARRLARALSRRQKVFRYVFDAKDTGLPAGHGVDLFFWYRNAHTTLPIAPVTGAEDQMTGYLGRFVATGDPNGGGAPAWAAYDAARDNVEVLDERPRADSGIRTDACDFWDSLALP